MTIHSYRLTGNWSRHKGYTNGDKIHLTCQVCACVLRTASENADVTHQVAKQLTSQVPIAATLRYLRQTGNTLPHSTANARKCKDGSPLMLVVTLQHKLKKWNAIFGQGHPKEPVLFSTSEILSLQIMLKKFLQQATVLYRQCVQSSSVKPAL